MPTTYKIPKRFIFTQSFNDCRRGEVYTFNSYLDNQHIYYNKKYKYHYVRTQWRYGTLCLLVKNNIIQVF